MIGLGSDKKKTTQETRNRKDKCQYSRISEKDPTPTNIYWGRVGGGTKKHLRGTIPSAKSIVFKKTNIF